MQSSFIIKDKTGKPYAVVVILAGGTEFYPIAESATGWASWMKDEYAARKISKEQLVATLDNSMDLEGPLSSNRTNKAKIDELIAKAKKVPSAEPIESVKKQKSELVPVISLMDVRLDNLENTEWQNSLEFKAKSFIADMNSSTFGYEVKRTRAAWDPTLAVPGTDRQGGWRCPPGTRFGGQITDRFGRNCGWGASRRIANEISDLGERLENVGDRRRERRVVRRNDRMVRRLQQGGAIERAAGRVGNVLDVTGRDNGPTAAKPRGAGLIERVAGRVAGALETDTTPNRQRGPKRQQGPNRQRGGIVERAAGRVARALETDGEATPVRRPRPAAPRAPQARPQAPRAPQARPARPRQPRRLPNAARPAQVAPDSSVPVPAGPPNRNESLAAYKTRKYNEHQQKIRELNEAGGNAGLLRRSEWDEFHGPVVEENWNNLQQQNSGRAARRTATNAGAARVATRRPKPADVPDAVQPPRRERKPFAAPNQRGYASEAAAKRKRAELESANPQMRGDYKIVKHNGKYYAVSKAEVDRANANGANIDVVPEAPRPGPRPQVTPPPPVGPTSLPPLTPVTPLPQNSGAAARAINVMRNRHDASMPILAGPDGRVERISVGNKGINTVEQALAHRGPLSDIPDVFIFPVLNSKAASVQQLGMNAIQIRDFDDRISRARINPSLLSPEDKAVLKQFKDDGKNFYLFKGSSITAPQFFMKINDDGSIDGRGYLFKPEDRDAKGRGQHAELLGIEIARRMGFAQSAPRVIDTSGGVSLLLELGPNFAEGHVKPFKKDEVVDGRSRLGHFVANMLLGAGDRHGNNGMHFDGDGALPIDFGRAFQMREDASVDSMVRYLGAFRGLDDSPLQGYANALQQGKTEAQVKAQIKQDLTEWKTKVQAMFDDRTYESFKRLVPNSGTGRQDWLPVTQRKQYIVDRLALLDSDEFINALWAQTVRNNRRP